MKKVFSKTTLLVSANIKRLRVRRGLTQRALAERLGTSESSVISWEKPTRSPTTDSLHNLAAVLRVHPWRLLVCLDDDTTRLIAVFSRLGDRGKQVVLSVAEGQALSESDD